MLPKTLLSRKLYFQSVVFSLLFVFSSLRFSTEFLYTVFLFIFYLFFLFSSFVQVIFIFPQWPIL